MDTYCDGIILGAGHNGLILQAYLARAGLEVVCLERSDRAGGGLRTEELAPGFIHNTHAFYHRALTAMPWYGDLELERHGASYIEPELNVALLQENGPALEWWTDFDKTAESFAHFSCKDAAALRRWRDAFLPIVEGILVPEAQAPPLAPQKRQHLLAGSAEGRLLLDTSRLSPLEFVRREFEHPLVQAGLLFFNGLREVDLRAPGFGHHIPALLASPGKAQMCRGGSARLADALVAAVETSGGQVRLGAIPERILVDNQRLVGVELASGERLGARHFVASCLNPQQTFLGLLDEGVLPGPWKQRAQNYRYNLLAPLFGLYLNLEEPPVYNAAGENPHLEQAFMAIIGLESVEDFDGIVAAHAKGAIPPTTAAWGSCPSRFDPSQAPEGQHTAFMWEKVPYALRGDPDNWHREAKKHGEDLLEVWRRYAPNLETAVLGSFVRSPLDIQNTLPNMHRADLLVGSLSHGQVGYNRPFAGAGEYRTFLEGLYLCGSCCHPGGNITGLPGYNCAQVLSADLGLDTDWFPPALEERLSGF